MPRRAGYQDSLIFTTSMCFIFTVLIASLRVWIRRRSYGIDDLIIAGATILTFAHTATSYIAFAFGLGDPWTVLRAEKNVIKLNDVSLAGIVLFLLPLYLSKLAMIAFLGRIARNTAKSRYYTSCSVVLVLLCILSVILAFAGCSTPSGYYWDLSGNGQTCTSEMVRWQTITGLDVFSEIVLLLLPVHLVWDLRMPRGKKLMLTSAFWIRIPVLILSLFRNQSIIHLKEPDIDVGLQSALVVILIEIELAYALAAGTLSASKAFTESFNSSFGLGFARGRNRDDYYLSRLDSSAKQARHNMADEVANRAGGVMPRSQDPSHDPHLISAISRSTGGEIVETDPKQRRHRELTSSLSGSTPTSSGVSMRDEKSRESVQEDQGPTGVLNNRAGTLDDFANDDQDIVPILGCRA